MRFILALVLTLLTTPAVADSKGPGDCKFFNALTFSADKKSTDVAAYNKPFDMRIYRTATFQVVWASLTGSIDGTCKVQVCTLPTPVESCWVDKSGATFNLSGANGTDVINVATGQEPYYRVTCAHGNISGGTITGYCFLKD